MSTQKIINKPSLAPEDIDAQAGGSEPANLEDWYLKGINAANTTSDIYNKRLLYKSQINLYTGDYPNLVDFNFAEKHLYGRTSRSFVPIIPSNIGAQLVSLKQAATAESDLKTFDFVEENFTEMAYQFKKAVMSRKIDSKDPYLSELLLYKAYENPENRYSDQ